MTASFRVLTTGYADARVAGTVTLVIDDETVAIVDPGMVADRRLILDPLAHSGLAPEDVTDVIFSHYHPDRSLNAVLFPEARFHDHMAVCHEDIRENRNADGYRLSPSITLMTTPGHTAEDVSTLVTAVEGLVVLTHLWWSAQGPADDPFVLDREQLRASREKVLALGPALIVPGHGAPFVPSSSTPV
ncbi:MBL fold metallo-hydrolase [Streptomyces sporangiiformans]|uniref:Metallo-beta-lactamase domain-containing protein 1 n=2 Tax=Streptomyces sporangiiformans TaxID=2315329 RepID=A0A505DH68_9ACTN|nr:MBL fold metallo-hydrolase [Streptomyces sporangiiformans]TPQ22547.1 MBL fold metallo-hydrolase [Streptomyces sporangiiformans]